MAQLLAKQNSKAHVLLCVATHLSARASKFCHNCACMFTWCMFQRLFSVRKDMTYPRELFPTYDNITLSVLKQLSKGQLWTLTVGPVWIKVAIVDTRTPFLISNNVLRQLGAVIDTEDQSIYFKRLQCSAPLSLTDRKLFTLDISEMIEIAKDTKFTRSVKIDASNKPQPVFLTESHKDQSHPKESQWNHRTS